MPIYKTKHAPIDDNPYIVYGATQSNVPDMVTYIGIEATKSIEQGANYTFPVTM